MTAERQILHAYLSKTARNAWHSFAEENGVSVTGLLEALGIELAGDIEANGMGIRQDWAESARRVDTQRRRRSTVLH